MFLAGHNPAHELTNCCGDSCRTEPGGPVGSSGTPVLRRGASLYPSSTHVRIATPNRATRQSVQAVRNSSWSISRQSRRAPLQRRHVVLLERDGSLRIWRSSGHPPLHRCPLARLRPGRARSPVVASPRLQLAKDSRGLPTHPFLRAWPSARYLVS